MFLLALAIIMILAPAGRWFLQWNHDLKPMSAADNRESGVCFGIGIALLFKVIVG